MLKTSNIWVKFEFEDYFEFNSKNLKNIFSILILFLITCVFKL